MIVYNVVILVVMESIINYNIDAKWVESLKL